MPGRKKTVRSVAGATDDGRGAFLPGKTACPGTMLGVQEVDGVRVVGSPSIEA